MAAANRQRGRQLGRLEGLMEIVADSLTDAPSGRTSTARLSKGTADRIREVVAEIRQADVDRMGLVFEDELAAEADAIAADMARSASEFEAACATNHSLPVDAGHPSAPYLTESGGF